MAWNNSSSDDDEIIVHVIQDLSQNSLVSVALIRERPIQKLNIDRGTYSRYRDCLCDYRFYDVNRLTRKFRIPIFLHRRFESDLPVSEP